MYSLFKIFPTTCSSKEVGVLRVVHNSRIPIPFHPFHLYTQVHGRNGNCPHSFNTTDDRRDEGVDTLPRTLCTKIHTFKAIGN